MRIATTKSDLKKKLQVGVSSRVVDKVDATVIDGCALLWSVHWPEKGTAKDYVDNFSEYVMRKAAHSDVYLTFDRYYDYSIKSVTRGARAGKHATHRHHLNLSSPLPPQKVVLTVNENNLQGTADRYDMWLSGREVFRQWRTSSTQACCIWPWTDSNRTVLWTSE